MTDIEKNLLKIDLCCRLPYNVKVHAKYTDLGETIELDGIVKMIDADGVVGIEVINDFSSAWTYVQIDNVKPYLFPLSSMTEEQKRELLDLTGYEARCEESCGFDSWGFYVNIVGEYKYEDSKKSIILYPDDIGIDWLNKNHFDYRGLIEKDLAIDATGLNVY